MNIISDDASPIMSRIVGTDLADFTADYPGASVLGVPDSQVARAAIEFSNGRGVAWLPIQLKEMFGDTTFIAGVTIGTRTMGSGRRTCCLGSMRSPMCSSRSPEGRSHVSVHSMDDADSVER